jgi:hypothetical protein
MTENLGSIHGMDKLFSSPKHPDWLWGPHKLLFSGYWRLHPCSETNCMELTVTPLSHMASWHGASFYYFY